MRKIVSYLWLFHKKALLLQHETIRVSPKASVVTDLLHPFPTTCERPERMNNPFDYVPHPLCKEAAQQVCNYLTQLTDWQEETAAGKMLGVLVCEDQKGQLGFLAAYSGQVLGRSDWPWFVPAVFDYLQPDGYFKQEEAEITAINRQIATLESASSLVSARAEYERLKNEADSEIRAYTNLMREAKASRDAQRDKADDSLSEQQSSLLIRESQFQKAELHRLKKRWQQRLAEAEDKIRSMEDEITLLKHERKQRSDALQRWLFDQFLMANVKGERRTLTDIFSHTPQHVPPAGSGECCAPKLLQYAFLHSLKPLQMAEFWYGRSPRMEIRHHGQYYPACRGKCKPILEWMLNLSPTPSLRTDSQSIHTFDASAIDISELCLYSESSFLVINKPSGLLSVPGLTGESSVESLLRKQYGEVYIVHRLDQDTSGLMVIALTKEAYHHLQKQFLEHTIYKRYVALLDGEVQGRGTISLPLRPDLTDRPRQLVDFEQGKEAITDYEVLDVSDGITRIALTPHTGRTHQLRMHCAHSEGLGTPILGDSLYGRPADRLYLHAEALSFDHPETGSRLSFTVPAPFSSSLKPQ